MNNDVLNFKETYKEETNKNESLVKQSSSLKEEIALLPVTTLEQHEIALVKLNSIKEFKKEVDNFFKPNIDAANKLHKSLVAQRKSIIEPVENVESALMSKMRAYQNEQKRIAEEAIAAAKKEEERLRKENEERLLARAIKEEENGAPASVVDAIANYQIPVEVKPEIPTMPKVDKRVFREPTWTYKVVDINQVPREYLCIDDKIVKAIVKAKKGNTKIAGIEVYQDNF